MHIARSVGLVLLVFNTFVVAQVPVSKDPDHTVAFENSQFRVLNVNIPPGKTTTEHVHELDVATVSMMASPTDTRTQLPGQPWSAVRPRRPLGQVEVTEYTGKPGVHRVENVGKGAYQLFAVENLKKGGWSATPAVSAAATKLATESRAFRVYNVTVGRGQQSGHTHAVPTIVVLLSGRMMSDGSSNKAKENAPAAVGLKQLVLPGEWLLVPAGDTHHLVALANTEGQVVEIEVR